MRSNKFKGIIIYFIVIFLLIFGLVSVLNMAGGTGQKTTPYSQVIAEFDNLNVSEYILDLGSGDLAYKLKGDGDQYRTYSVPNVSIFLNDINTGYTETGELATYRVRYNEVNETALVEDYIPIADNTFLTSVLPYLLLIGIMIIFTVVIMRSSAGGGKMSSFSKANIRQQSGKKVTFNDVAGADEEKEELEEIGHYETIIVGEVGYYVNNRTIPPAQGDGHFEAMVRRNKQEYVKVEE